MGLSNDLISQFVKITKDSKKTNGESTVYGTTVKHGGKICVMIDGSTIPTPVTTTTNVEPGQRVTVMIKNHSAIITGNVTAPSATDKEVKEVEQKLESGDYASPILRIDSSRGTVFKNNQVSTVLSAVIYRGSKRITDITALRTEFGETAYLEWSWQRMGEDVFGTILSTDSRLSNGGFTFTLSPTDVDTKVTFMCQLITDD